MSLLVHPFNQSICLTVFFELGETNKHRYILAVQHPRLRSQLRMIPGVPIAHFNDRGVLVMELPSDATMKQKDMVCNLPPSYTLPSPLLTVLNDISSKVPS